jgi:hypothetical protein
LRTAISYCGIITPAQTPGSIAAGIECLCSVSTQHLEQ